MSLLRFWKVAQPPAPAANSTRLYVDTVDNLLKTIDQNSLVRKFATDQTYNALDYGFKNDDLTDNLAAWNTLYALLPVNATVYFPFGTYRFSGALEGTDKHITVLGDGAVQSILKTTSATANLFNFAAPSWYWSFINLGFQSSVVRTAGAYINVPSDCAYLAIEGCEFQGYFNAVSLSSNSAGNLGIINNSFFNTPAVNGTAITINGGAINIMLTNINMNSGTVAGSIGLKINASGAVQMMGCDIIGGVNCLLVNATGVVSSLFFTNTFFDQSTLGSTVKFSGAAGAISRVKFDQCGITCGTTGSVGLVACEIAGTGTGNTIPEGIDFVNCELYNNSGAGTTVGFLVTGCKQFNILNCRIAGFTFGIDVTPYNTAGFTRFDICDNIIGATDNFAANGTGIRLNAGAVAYGSFQINGNAFLGNTTNITDNSSFPTGTAAIYQKSITNNIGTIAFPAPANYANTVIPLTTITAVDSRGGMYIPAATRPCVIRITVQATNAATAQTLTATLRYGVNNSNADTAVLTQAFTAGTAAVGSGVFVFDVNIQSSTTLMAALRFYNGNNAATGIAGSASLFAALNTMATISTAASNWLGVYFSCATAGSVITIRSVSYEVISQ